MLPFKKIVCPTDFSEPSYEALKAANELALHFSAYLILVHVVSPIPVVPAPTSFEVILYEEELRKSAEKSLQEVLEERVSKELQARAVVKRGDAAHEIVQLVTDEKADLIVIATHGWTGWRRLVFGSVAEKVVRLATCPVLTIRAPREEG